MQNKRPSAPRFNRWPHWLLAGAVVALICSLYTFRLGGFIGLSPAETATVTANQSIRSVAADPLNLPYKLLDSIFLHIPAGPLELRARAASVVLALLSIVLFYFIVRRWHGGRNALLATLLFAPSGWMLQTGRFGSGLIMLTFTILSLIAANVWLGSTQPRKWTLAAYSLLCAALLFVPAGVWFVLAAIFAWRHKLADHIGEAGLLQRMIASLLPAIAVAAIVFSSLRQPHLALQWLGLPLQLPELIVLAKQAASSVAYLVARGPYIPEVWLAHTPVFDVASGVLLLLGIVFYARHWQSDRVRQLAIFAALAIILITLHGAYALAYLVPVAYLVAATGLVYLLRMWQRVFPRNPFAHSLSAIAIVGLLLATGIYHTERYFTAWRKSPDTRQAYRPVEEPQAPSLIQ